MQWALRLGLIVLCGTARLPAALTPQQIFDNVLARVQTQLKNTYNYTCVQTLTRTSYTNTGAQRGCKSRNDRAAGDLSVRDRLRLDVAVSDGKEMFSWHGGKSFSSNDVMDVVPSGSIASGSFVGYLENIFFHRGVHISYSRQAAPDRRFHFNYDVPLSASANYISTATGRSLVAYRGEFEADPQTFQLTSLSASVDRPPRNSKICRTSSEVKYQTVDISGSPSRIPQTFTLRIEHQNGFFSTIESTYQSCRAFTGESTINFGADTFQPPASDAASLKEQALPAGVTLPVTVQTPIDEMRSFTGDPVEGVLTRAVKVRKKGITLPKGATVSGVVTRLETHFQPVKFYVLSIRFDHVAYRNTLYAMEAIPVVSRRSMDNLHSVYGPRFSDYVENGMTKGVIILSDPHLRLNQHEAQDWVTVTLPKDEKP